jgi:hypothetical protein
MKKKLKYYMCGEWVTMLPKRQCENSKEFNHYPTEEEVQKYSNKCQCLAPFNNKYL